ncbi:FAD:protein FMN transferase [Spirochaeta africana]|uniref:FAD:protein FMN transferase n=1 Tax=Spirochaeta africana (strain ATCC 700263 / DSM 8902 / Z-7692) TaxID=889378 RepID=H9UMT8_SPIAZ|nr:FAD:protein FMN transferase [Spirochaeta africana]AFG38831.1 membrane-associated lipoprotein involved in thiamine biosynthesis [Spirochaeta africana DSM 8902]
MSYTPSSRIAAVVRFSLLILAVFLIGCNTAAPTSESRLKLGTNITITIHDTVPRGIFPDIWTRFDEIEQKMSINESRWDDTELLQVNQAAGDHPVTVSDETLLVVQEGLRVGELTDGAFDVTVAPLVLLWMVTGSTPQVPDQERVAAARELIDYTRVQIEGNAIYLPEPGMGIDVGGVAKGYAAAEAARLLREAGVNHAILDLGGDVVALGTRPDGRPWRIGLQDPTRRRGALMGVVEVIDTAIVTSGVYERFFEQDGVRYHHIIDPFTGYPTRNELTSVTILSSDPTYGDALSTGTFVMGLETGFNLIEELEDVEGIFIDEQQRVFLTSGVRDSFRLLSDEFAVSCADDIAGGQCNSDS